MRSHLLLMTAALPALAFSASSIVNGDFEEFKDGWPVGWMLPSQFKVERGAGSNGSTGLVFENDDSKYRQAAALQNIDVKPGDVFELGGWVNIEKLAPGSGGCMFVCIWTDKDGQYVGETQSGSVRRPTKGWIKLEGITRALPPNAAKASFGFYSRNGNVGRIAVDKVYCRPYIRKAVVGVFSDAYRNETADGPVRFVAPLTPAAFGKDAQDVRAVFAVTRPDGTTFEVPAKRPAPDEAEAVIDLDKFGLGTNRVVCILTAGGAAGVRALPNGCREIGSAETVLVRTAANRSRKTRIDRFGRAIVDGKPFFPMGAFMNHVSEAALAEYAAADFNCVMTYGAQPKRIIDFCHEKGLKVVYYLGDHWEFPDKGTNFVRQTVAEFKDHPAVIAWYIYDERPTSEMPILNGRHNLIVSLDDDHPTWVSQDIPEEARHYLGSFDVFGGDAYPIPYRDISSIGTYLDVQTRQQMGIRAAWQVPQYMSWHWYRPGDATLRCPTFAEFRNMTWQEIAGGARGILGYCLNETTLWEQSKVDPAEWKRVYEDVKKIAHEVRFYERQLLLAESRPFAAGEGLMGRTFSENGETWKLTVNVTYEKRGGLEPLDIKFEKVNR